MHVDDRVQEYLAETFTDDDARTLDFAIGDCRGQAAAEAMAILMALRTWLPLWGSMRSAVAVRSDSVAALGALGKLGSTAPAINRVAREVALDVALSRYGVDVWTHVRAEYNTDADALSRLSEPGAKYVVPPHLAAVKRATVQPRDQEWWSTSSTWWTTRISQGTPPDMDTRTGDYQ